MTAQIDSIGINVVLAREKAGCGDHVVHLTQKSFVQARVVVAAPERREHHEDARLPVGRRVLVIVARHGVPDLADRVAVAAGDPDDGWMLLPIARTWGQVCR